MLFSEHLTQTILSQNKHRKSWEQQDTPEHLDEYLREEFEELLGAIELCELGADPFELISELGDMGYLWIKRRSFDVPVAVDIAENMMFCERLCAQLNLTMEECAEFKVWRNEYKYPQMVSNNGYGYDRSRSISKDFYQYLGGDKVFYYAYMMMADDLQHSSAT